MSAARARIRGIPVRVYACMLLCLLMAGCATTRCPMCGHWKSDEARTVEGMRTAQAQGKVALSQTDLDRYSGKFFGRLQIECDREHCRAWFPEEDPETKPWFAYLLTPTRERVWQWSLPELDIPARTVELQPDGACYAIEQSQLGFDEWFCRIDAGTSR